MMARRVDVFDIDDIDGSQAAEHVRFALDGVEFEIDLSEANAARLRATLSRFVRAARRTGGRRRPAGQAGNGASG